MRLLRSFVWVVICSSWSFDFGQGTENPRFQFGVIADVQYCACENSGTRHYSQSPEKLAEAVAELNQHDLKFVVSLGDFIDRDFQSYDTLISIANDLKCPLNHALGNHEYAVDEPFKAQIPGLLGLQDRYYSKSLKGWKFIYLDGNRVSLYGAEKGSDEYKEAEGIYAQLKQSEAPNAQTWNGALGRTQLTWLREELEKAKRKKQRVMLFCHFPVIPKKAAHNLWDDAVLLELINKYNNVVAYFNGHTHKGHYQQENNVHHLAFEGMVEQDTNAFAIVSVFDDRLEIKGFGREQDRVLKFE